MGNIDNLTGNLNQLFSKENILNLSKTLSHVEQVTEVLATQRSDLAETIRQINTLSKEANVAMHDISRLARNTDKLIGDQGQRVLNNAAQSMATLEQATRRIDQLISNNQAPLQNGLQSLNDLGPAMQELRAALASLNRLSRRLEEDPSGFLLDREKNEEFQP